MRAISIECVIGGDPYSARQLDDIEHARHVHVLHDLKQLGVAIEHGGHPLSNEGIDLLSLEQARSVSAPPFRKDRVLRFPAHPMLVKRSIEAAILCALFPTGQMPIRPLPPHDHFATTRQV